MMPLYDGGGYRTEEQISDLKESIKKNGINTPIEIVKKPNEDYAIEDGNHRLQIANELGIKEVPVKLVESWESIVARKMSEEVKTEYGTNTIAKTTNTSNENSRNSSGMLRNSDELSGNGRRTTRDAGISTSKSNSNQQTSSLQNQRNNREQENLENSEQSSFSLPKTWEKVETNVKSRITPEMEKDMKRFVQNNFVNYEKVEGETVDDYVDELIKKIYTPDELEYIGDEDLGSEVFDAVYNTVDEFIEEAGYTYKRPGDKSYFEPDMSSLEDSDEIRMEYDRLPRTDFEFAQLEKIRARGSNKKSDRRWTCRCRR